MYIEEVIVTEPGRLIHRFMPVALQVKDSTILVFSGILNSRLICRAEITLENGNPTAVSFGMNGKYGIYSTPEYFINLIKYRKFIAENT